MDTVYGTVVPSYRTIYALTEINKENCFHILCSDHSLQNIVNIRSIDTYINVSTYRINLTRAVFTGIYIRINIINLIIRALPPPQYPLLLLQVPAANSDGASTAQAAHQHRLPRQVVCCHDGSQEHAG